MKSDYVFVDTETTGLNHDTDEILSVSVIDDEGICLFHSLIKPQRITEWGEAEKVNGISAEMVEHAPTFESVKAHLRDIFRNKEVIIYNAGFDTVFLGETLKESKAVHCCMQAFADYKQEWSEKHHAMKWFKLVNAVAEVNPKFSFKAHDSLEDCRATREVWDFLMTVPEIREKYRARA